MACSGIVFLSGLGIESVKKLYVLKSPLCWRPSLVGYYSAFEMFVHGIGGVVGVKLFSRFFKEMTVARIGLVTQILASILLAFSDRTWMVFVGKQDITFNIHFSDSDSEVSIIQIEVNFLLKLEKKSIK